MSSTNFGPILVFASCVVGTCNILVYVGEFFYCGRGHLVFVKNNYIYIYTYIYIYFLNVITLQL